MLDLQEVDRIYRLVVNMYDSGVYTQKAIANELNISLNAVVWCTQHLGYYHTKASQGKRAIYFLADLIPLQNILNNS